MRLRLRERNALFESCNNHQVASDGSAVLRFERNRRPELSVVADERASLDQELEAGRHHADNNGALSSQHDFLAYDIWRAAEAPLPESVA